MKNLLVKRKIWFNSLSIILLAFISMNLQSQDSKEDDASALAKQSANPIANLISVPIQANLNFGYGDYNRSGAVVNIQPAIPFRLSSKVNVINRIILPVIYQPDNAESGGTFGLGNINYSMFFTPSSAGKFTWGVGPAFNIPTLTTDQLGANAFGIGPTAVGLLVLEHAVIGATFNRIWSYNGSDVNSFFAQYFITYNMAKGWYVNTNPNIYANLNAADGEQWTVPFGLGGGRVTHFGDQPIKLQVQYYFNAIRPTGAAKSTLMVQLVFLFPPG